MATILLFSTFGAVGVFPASAAVKVDTLNGKTAIFVGDSITYGYMDTASSPRSWALRLQRDYGMTVSNKGQNGCSLSDVRDYTAYGNADKRLHVQCFDNGNYDYVILQGGVNDIIGAESDKGHPNPGIAVEVGTVAATKNAADFDTNTFAGGLERYFYEATTRYPNARIGFIITYRTPNSTWDGETRDADAYWQIAREICAKWDIPYLDLYDDSYSIDVLKADTNTYLADNLHLNAAGYEVITPYIAQWMMTLQPYGAIGISLTTDSNITAVTSERTTAGNGAGSAAYSVSTTRSDHTDRSTSAVASVNKGSKTAAAIGTTTAIHNGTKESTQRSNQEMENSDDERSDNKSTKTDYTWLVIILAAASVAVLATVIVTIVHSHMR